MPPELTIVPAKEVDTKKVQEKEKQEKKVVHIPIKRTIIPLIEVEEVIPSKLAREPTGVKPIIPTGDSCCVGVCTHLNNEIDSLGQAINIRQEELKYLSGSSRMRTRRQLAVLTTKISTLKDIRFTFLDKNICKCFELPKGK